MWQYIGKCCDMDTKKEGRLDPPVIRLGKPCGIYILIIKSLRTNIFTSPIFVPCMAYNIILRFAFAVQMEIEWLHKDSLILSNANLQIFFEIIAYLPVNNHQ